MLALISSAFVKGIVVASGVVALGAGDPKMAIDDEPALVRCDALAGHPDDPDLVNPGLEGDEINVDAAEEACRLALAQNPGDRHIQFTLARILYYDYRDEEAAEFLARAAEAGSPIAQQWLGEFYWFGTGVEQDYATAIGYFEEAAAQGWGYANLFLGDAYWYGQGVDPDQEAALAHYIAAGEAGLPAGDLAAADLLTDGMDIDDFAQAETYYRRAMEADDGRTAANAMNNFAYALWKRGERLPEAWDFALQSLELNTEDVDLRGNTYDTAAVIAFDLGYQEEAIDYIKQSTGILTTSAEVWDHAGDIFAALGHTDEALAAWERSLAEYEASPELQSPDYDPAAVRAKLDAA